MFEFNFDDPNKKNSPAHPNADSTALTQAEVAEIIRIAEDHHLSSTARYQLLLLARNRKRQTYNNQKRIKAESREQTADSRERLLIRLASCH